MRVSGRKRRRDEDDQEDRRPTGTGSPDLERHPEPTVGVLDTIERVFRAGYAAVAA